jgi:hypothetical protein
MAIDLYVLALLVDQRLRKALADLVVLQDIGLHVDVVARRGDGFQHRAVGGWAVLQQRHLVAGGQRAADDGFFERQVAIEDAGRLARRAQAIENSLALRRRQRAARALQLHRRAGRSGQVGHDGRQAAAAGDAQPQQQRHRLPQPKWPVDRQHGSSHCSARGLALTRQTMLPTSSATSNAPRLSIATPTGLPKA